VEFFETRPRYEPGATVLFRTPVSGYASGTLAKVVRVVEPAAAQFYIVEPYLLEDGAAEPTPSGVALLVGFEHLSEAGPLLPS
jgi:hypothetical protein